MMTTTDNEGTKKVYCHIYIRISGINKTQYRSVNHTKSKKKLQH